MKVLTVAMARNEQDMVFHFVRYYRQFSDVTLYDDRSDDDTAAVALAEGATVISMSQDDPELEFRLLWVKNESWKAFREQYDWVIMVDVDEFLYHKDLPHVLQHAQEQGATVLAPCGYQMVSFEPPSRDCPIPTMVRRGDPSHMYSKRCCFDPKRIHEIRYSVGAHHCNPRGHVVVLAYPDLKLLHYHFMNAERVFSRYAKRWEWRNYQKPADPNWCDHSQTLEELQTTIIELDARSTEVI
jgi:hypothetical protein